MEGILRTFRKKHPELDELAILFASTPDYKGALQDGFALAVESIVRELPQAGTPIPNQVTVLVSSAFTPGDVQELKEILIAFGLSPILVPDLAASLDGHLEDTFSSVTTGGTALAQLKAIGQSSYTLAIGESLRGAAEILQQRLGIPYTVFPSLTGLDAVDQLLQGLVDISGSPVPEKYRHQRRQLQDAMLDTHFFFGRKRITLALEPDLLWSTVHFLLAMGSEIHAAVTTTKSPLLDQLPIDQVTIGDLEDFERLAEGSDLLIANSNANAIANRLGLPLYRQGMPIFDRLGNGFFTKIGYRGTMQLLFDIGNLFLAQEEAQSH